VPLTHCGIDASGCRPFASRPCRPLDHGAGPGPQIIEAGAAGRQRRQPAGRSLPPTAPRLEPSRFVLPFRLSPWIPSHISSALSAAVHVSVPRAARSPAGARGPWPRSCPAKRGVPRGGVGVGSGPSSVGSWVRIFFFLARDLQLREDQKRERGLTLSGRKLPAVPWSIQCKSSKLLGPNGFLRYSSALICGIDRRMSPFSPTSYFFDYFLWVYL